MVQNGRPVSEVAQNLGIGGNLLYSWKSRSNKPATIAVVGMAAARVQLGTAIEQQDVHKFVREL